MDRSSTVARFIQRFREAAPLSPDERRRGRGAMEGQFWWAPSTKDSDFESDRSGHSDESGCGTPPPPPTQDAINSNRDFEASQSRGTRASSHRDLEAFRSRRRAPPPRHGEHTPLNFSVNNKTAVEASYIDAAPQDARSEFEGGCYPNDHKAVEASCEHAAPQDARVPSARQDGRVQSARQDARVQSTQQDARVQSACQDARVQSRRGCQPNKGRGQTTLAPSLLSPCSAGPPGPPSDDGGDGLAGLDGLHLVHQLHQQTLAGEVEVDELAASLPERQAAASTFGASSSRLPGENFVGGFEVHDQGIDAEGCDELANLDARASSLLEHCRQLLSAPPTDDADQEATHILPDPFSSGGGSSTVGGVGVVAYASSQGLTRQSLEQRAWMLLDNLEPQEPWEVNLHGSLRVLPTGGDIDLLPAVRSHRYGQASPALSRQYDQTARETDFPPDRLFQQAVPTEGFAQQTAPIEGLTRAINTEVSATYGSADGSTFNTDGSTFNTDGSTFRKTVSGLLNGGGNRAWSSQQEKKEAKGDNCGDSQSLFLRNEGDDCGDSRPRLLGNEFHANPAAPCMVGGTDLTHTCGTSKSQKQKRCDRELTLPELSATGDVLTGMDSVLSEVAEGEMRLGIDRDGLVDVPDANDFRHRYRTTHTSSGEPSSAVSSSFGLGRNRSQQEVSAMTPSARGGRKESSINSVASLKAFAEDPVMVALVERAHQIEAELERRRLFGIFDGKQPPPTCYEKVGPDGLH